VPNVTRAAELTEAILAVLSMHSLTLPQLVDKLQQDPKWKRVDPKVTKSILRKLEDDYQVIHERDGGAIRYRWFSPHDARVIGERNHRLRQEQLTTAQNLLREGLGFALLQEHLCLIPVAGLGDERLDGAGLVAAITRICIIIARHVELPTE